jgi:hypothetical protein
LYELELCAFVTSFDRIQFASAYGLVSVASQISHSKVIGFSAKVHAASVQRRLGGAPIGLFGLLIPIGAWRCAVHVRDAQLGFEGKTS